MYLTRQVGASADRGATARPQDETVAPEGDVRVPVREERLEVDKQRAPDGRGAGQHDGDLGAADRAGGADARGGARRAADVADRPATEADLAGAFQEGTIRVPVRGEEAVARKETVVTGEVVIDKTRTTETEQITDTVRRERVEVDEDYDRARAAYQQQLAARPGAPTPEEAEPYFRTGYAAARDARYAGKTFEEVEPELRRSAGVADESAWERIKREVREGFTGARER